MDGRPVDLLVDTGSGKSLVRQDQVPTSAVMQKIDLGLPTANGSTLLITGSVNALLPQGKLELLVSPNLLPTGILGFEDMARLGISVDCASGTLQSSHRAALSVSDPVEELKSKYSATFACETKKHTLASATPLSLELKHDAKPPFVDHGGPVFTQEEDNFASQQVQDWLHDGIIKPSTSASRTYLLVARNGKKLRLCPAFLALNGIPNTDTQSMMKIDVICCVNSCKRVAARVNLD